MELTEIRIVRGFEPDSSGPEKGLLEGYCEHGSDPAVSVQCSEFLEQLSVC
jgi:hypothetical protein